MCECKLLELNTSERLSVVNNICNMLGFREYDSLTELRTDIDTLRHKSVVGCLVSIARELDKR